MKVITDLRAFPRLPGGSAVTIGAFDGVHLGHRALLNEVRRRSTAGGHKSVVVTFDRHPATVVRPESAPKLLTDLDQKLDLLAETGDVDYVAVIRFDYERSQEEAEDFVSEVLVDAVQARVVVVGIDFHFGRGRRGNVELLRRNATFEVVGFDLVGVAGIRGVLSSTAIRGLLSAGEVEEAASLLGRAHEVRGEVHKGNQRGKELGFPTANVDVPEGIALPAEGIYAGWYVRPDGGDHAAAISLGRRPTFYDTDAPSVLEAYLLDFEGDLYGETARVRFVRRLRDQKRFESRNELVTQTERDVEATRAALQVRR